MASKHKQETDRQIDSISKRTKSNTRCTIKHNLGHIYVKSDHIFYKNFIPEMYHWKRKFPLKYGSRMIRMQTSGARFSNNIRTDLGKTYDKV